MASSRVWSSVLMLVLGVSVVASAQAQTLGGIGVTVGTNVQRRADREQGRLPVNSITYADCIAGGTDPEQWDYLEVPLTYSQSQGRKLQVWAGTDAICSSDVERAKAAATTCWQVFTGDPVRELRLPVRSLLPGAGDATTTAVCEKAQQDTFTLFFLLVRGTSSDDTTVGKLEMEYDLVGPSAPTGVRVNPGEERLTLKWSSSDTETDSYALFCEEALAAGTGPTGGSGGTATTMGGTAGTDSGGTATTMGGTAGADSGGTAGTGGGLATDGGTAGVAGANGGNGGDGIDAEAGADGQAAAAGTSGGGTAGTSGGGTAGTTGGSAATGGSAGRNNANACSAATLRPGERPPAALRRGRTSSGAGQGTTGAATGLKNFVKYACGVAALDESFNVGPLSELRCETPIEVTDYFEAYRRAGGTAGGGYCSFGQQPPRSWSLLGLAGLALVARRIRRDRSR